VGTNAGRSVLAALPVGESTGCPANRIGDYSARVSSLVWVMTKTGGVDLQPEFTHIVARFGAGSACRLIPGPCIPWHH
jgi:mevalonate pyrophosphate decarboxylase